MDLVRPDTHHVDRNLVSAHGTADREGPARSSFGEIPGAELPGGVYGMIIAAYAWMLVAAWIAFGSDAESDLNLSIVVALTVVFFALPIVMRRIAVSRSRARENAFDAFLSRRIEIATGPLPAQEVLLQVLLIPIALAAAATMIGAVYIMVG